MQILIFIYLASMLIYLFCCCFHLRPSFSYDIAINNNISLSYHKSSQNEPPNISQKPFVTDKWGSGYSLWYDPLTNAMNFSKYGISKVSNTLNAKKFTKLRNYDITILKQYCIIRIINNEEDSFELTKNFMCTSWESTDNALLQSGYVAKDIIHYFYSYDSLLVMKINIIQDNSLIIIEIDNPENVAFKWWINHIEISVINYNQVWYYLNKGINTVAFRYSFTKSSLQWPYVITITRLYIENVQLSNNNFFDSDSTLKKRNLSCTHPQLIDNSFKTDFKVINHKQSSSSCDETWDYSRNKIVDYCDETNGYRISHVTLNKINNCKDFNKLHNTYELDKSTNCKTTCNKGWYKEYSMFGEIKAFKCQQCSDDEYYSNGTCEKCINGRVIKYHYIEINPNSEDIVSNYDIYIPYKKGGILLIESNTEHNKENLLNDYKIFIKINANEFNEYKTSDTVMLPFGFTRISILNNNMFHNIVVKGSLFGGGVDCVLNEDTDTTVTCPKGYEIVDDNMFCTQCKRETVKSISTNEEICKPCNSDIYQSNSEQNDFCMLYNIYEDKNSMKKYIINNTKFYHQYRPISINHNNMIVYLSYKQPGLPLKYVPASSTLVQQGYIFLISPTTNYVTNLGSEISSINYVNTPKHNGLVFLYTKGDLCQSNTELKWSTILYMKCAKDILNEKEWLPKIIGYNIKTCQYIIEYYSLESCRLCLSNEIEKVYSNCDITQNKRLIYTIAKNEINCLIQSKNSNGDKIGNIKDIKNNMEIYEVIREKYFDITNPFLEKSEEKQSLNFAELTSVNIVDCVITNTNEIILILLFVILWLFVYVVVVWFLIHYYKKYREWETKRKSIAVLTQRSSSNA